MFPNGALVTDHFAAVKLGHQAAPELVNVLLEQGIHAASMFPGHVGVCELVRELMRQG